MERAAVAIEVNIGTRYGRRFLLVLIVIVKKRTDLVVDHLKLQIQANGILILIYH